MPPTFVDVVPSTSRNSTASSSAAVIFGYGPEFRFKNDTGYPVRLDVTYENSRITVSVVGTKLDDTYVKMTCSPPLEPGSELPPKSGIVVPIAGLPRVPTRMISFRLL